MSRAVADALPRWAPHPSRSHKYRDALRRSAVYLSRCAGPGPGPVLSRRSRSWSRTAVLVPIPLRPALPVLPR